MKTLSNFKYWVFLVAIMFIYSCEEEAKVLDNAEFGYHYFPLEIGSYKIFRVDSTIIDESGNKIIESRSFIKEEITESYENEAGEIVFKVERSASETRDGDFRITDVWTAQKGETVATRTEENLRFNKLVFPLALGNEWQGNQFDNDTKVFIAGEAVKVYKDWGDYKIINKGTDLTVFGVDYSDVVSVEQANHDFILETRTVYEHYAPYIGLIKKEMTILDTQCNCPDEAWIDKAERGFIMTEILIEHN